MSKEKTSGAGSRSNIKRVGKLINAVCIVLQAISSVLGCLALVGIAILYVNPVMVGPFMELIDNTTVVQVINAITADSGIPARESSAINLFAFALPQGTLLAFFIVLRGLVKDITSNEKPFRVETAKQLRRNTLWLVLLMFWNLPAGLIILLVSFLFSYLIEYGAYLQESADETALKSPKTNRGKPGSTFAGWPSTRESWPKSSATPKTAWTTSGWPRPCTTSASCSCPPRSWRSPGA